MKKQTELEMNTMSEEEAISFAQTYRYEDPEISRLAEIADMRGDYMVDSVRLIEAYKEDPNNFDNLEVLFEAITLNLQVDV